MNRFLTLASSGLFATGLALLPISGFAQPSDVAKTATTPAMTQPMGSPDANTPAAGMTSAPTTRHHVVAAKKNLHPVKHVTPASISRSDNATTTVTGPNAANPNATNPAAASPMTKATSGTPMAAPTSQPKAGDQSKS